MTTLLVTQSSPNVVPPAERIATFNQEGTLCVEHPVCSQVMYILESVPALVTAKPEFRWLAADKGSRSKKPYMELTCLSMQEIQAYLRTNGYKTRIVTGSGQVFVRQRSEKVYGFPSKQVVGSAAGPA